MKAFVLGILLVITFVLTACGSGAQEVQAFNEPAKPDEPVRLTVFVYDSCGGCGVGLLGCGACDIQDRLHLQILAQFGDRLHDGSIRYRLHNTRLDIQNDMWLEHRERFEITEELQNILPAAFIGTEYEGIYLVGDELLPFIQEMFDRYTSGEAREEVQRDIKLLIESSTQQ